MILRRSIAFATFVLFIVGVSLGLADEGARVLIVAPSDRDTTALRLRDELTVLGFDVVVIEADAAKPSLSETARDARAAAAARVEAWPPEILLWVVDDSANDQTLRVSQSLQGPPDSEMLALRAVELLRGRLLPVPIASAAPSAFSEIPIPSAAPAPSVSIAPPISSAYVIQEKNKRVAKSQNTRLEKSAGYLGFVTLASPGGTSPSVQLALGGRLPVADRFAFDARIFLPLTANDAGNDDGEIALRPFVLALGIEGLLTHPEKPYFVSIGAGAGPVLLRFDGEPIRANLMGVSDASWAGYAYGRLGAGYRIFPSLRLRFDALVGPIFPEPVLRIAGREVASFGRPAVFLTLGAEVSP